MTAHRIRTTLSRRATRVCLQFAAVLAAAAMPATAPAETLAEANSSVRGKPPPAIEARTGQIADAMPIAVPFEFAGGSTITTRTTTTTTTTTSTSSTSTSTLADRPCGDPVALVAQLSSTGPDDTRQSRAVLAGDAQFVLRVAVGISPCALCTCDVNSSGSVSASDALIVLKNAVGQDVPLNCPPC